MDRSLNVEWLYCFRNTFPRLRIYLPAFCPLCDPDPCQTQMHRGQTQRHIFTLFMEKQVLHLHTSYLFSGPLSITCNSLTTSSAISQATALSCLLSPGRICVSFVLGFPFPLAIQEKIIPACVFGERKDICV